MKLAFALFFVAVATPSLAEELIAIAEITGGNSGVRGWVVFEQRDNGLTDVSGRIEGLKPVSSKHGIHIHENGIVSDSCQLVGDHYDPHDEPHGVHVGDLGNIDTNEKGVAVFILHNLPNVELSGPHSIIGRSFGVDSDEDSMDEEHHEDHVPIGCGVIKLVAGSSNK